jgi:hypothetical protein
MWATMSAKEEEKFEETAKMSMARYERETKTYTPPKEETKK